MGGRIFRTTVSTLTRFPGSYFDKLLSEEGALKHRTLDADGNFEIDMDPNSFHTILECLRWGRFHYHPDLCCIEKVAEDADFLGLHIVQALSEMEESCRSVSLSGRETATKKAGDVSSFALDCCLPFLDVPKLAREGIMEFKLAMNPPVPEKMRNERLSSCGPDECGEKFEYVDALFSQKTAQECFLRECVVRGYDCTWKYESFSTRRLEQIGVDRENPGHARYCFLNFLPQLHLAGTYTYLVATLRFRGDDSGGRKSAVKFRSDCETSSSKGSKNKRNPPRGRNIRRDHPYRESVDARGKKRK